MTYTISKTPNCTQNPIFTLTPTPAATFASNNINGNGVSGFVRINGATLANGGTYSMTLSAGLDSATVTNNFIVKIVDPCIHSIFETVPAPINTMAVTMPTAGPTT